MNRTKKRVDEVASPRTIHDLPEHVLTCSLSLPVGEAAALSPISRSELVPSRAAVALKEVGWSRKRKRRRSQRRAAFTPAGQRGASTTNDHGRSSSGCFERVGLEGINEPASCAMKILRSSSCSIKSKATYEKVWVRPRSQEKRRLIFRGTNCDARRSRNGRRLRHWRRTNVTTLIVRKPHAIAVDLILKRRYLEKQAVTSCTLLIELIEHAHGVSIGVSPTYVIYSLFATANLH
ncbi:hypothetical protein ALC62_05135 [Cyphomyrmex costatus]|uniref:Uncharacterized protein n=1 Tax=Cyphomyrmex costatus TaxID=456900 RepID=A0A195CW35_9HYME|nr:hypothetical protein ALC62_05135 [Cyphomyrmex costatus]